jgi:hypothetical protein
VTSERRRPGLTTRHASTPVRSALVPANHRSDPVLTFSFVGALDGVSLDGFSAVSGLSTDPNLASLRHSQTPEPPKVSPHYARARCRERRGTVGVAIGPHDWRPPRSPPNRPTSGAPFHCPDRVPPFAARICAWTTLRNCPGCCWDSGYAGRYEGLRIQISF